MSVKTVIIAALACEAELIARFFNITLIKTNGFTCGFNGEIAIVVSGVGANRVSCAVGYALARFAPTFWLNFGIAGGADKSVGDVFLIDAVYKNDGAFYPDMLTKANFAFSSLITCDEPTIKSAKTQTLYDMEGYDFALSASMFASVDKIALLKMVSDNCDGAKITPSFVSNLISVKIDNICEFITLFNARPTGILLLNKDVENDVLNLAKLYKLTHSQTLLTINKIKSLIRKNDFNFNDFASAMHACFDVNKNKKLAFNEFLRI